MVIHQDMGGCRASARPRTNRIPALGAKEKCTRIHFGRQATAASAQRKNAPVPHHSQCRNRRDRSENGRVLSRRHLRGDGLQRTQQMRPVTRSRGGPATLCQRMLKDRRATSRARRRSDQSAQTAVLLRGSPFKNLSATSDFTVCEAVPRVRRHERPENAEGRRRQRFARANTAAPSIAQAVIRASPAALRKPGGKNE